MSSMHPHIYISVAGVMGSGKTTASGLLAQHLGLHLFEENVDENTFLPLFYDNPQRWALHAQLFYLREKVVQLSKIKKLLEQTSVIQDSPLYQDYLTYAKAQQVLENMNEAEFTLYERFFHTLYDHLPVPDLVVQLDASVPAIAKRIKKRARTYERAIDRSYLALLARLQDQWIVSHEHLAILRINTETLNLAENTEHQREFVALVKDRLSTLAIRKQESLPLAPPLSRTIPV